MAGERFTVFARSADGTLTHKFYDGADRLISATGKFLTEPCFSTHLGCETLRSCQKHKPAYINYLEIQCSYAVRQAGTNWRRRESISVR
jgi:hypothetical protein